VAHKKLEQKVKATVSEFIVRRIKVQTHELMSWAEVQKMCGNDDDDEDDIYIYVT
jgi:hypothetical protein